jgi:hypothetical protein
VVFAITHVNQFYIMETELINNREEPSLRKFLTILMDWFRYLLSKWKLVFLASFLLACMGFIWGVRFKPFYTAKLSFFLSNDNSKSGGLSGLAGQYGIDIGGSGETAFAGDNIIELLKSDRIIKNTLFSTRKEIAGKTILDLYLEEANLLESYQKNKYLQAAIPFPKDDGNLSLLQDSLVKSICSRIRNSYLTIQRAEKKLVIYDVYVNSGSPTFSCYFTSNLVEKAAEFYIEIKTKTARANLKMLQKEADSIRILLGGKIVETATENDRTLDLNPALQVQRSRFQQGQLLTTVLATSYGEVVRNLEIAKMNVQKEMPLYQVLDVPTLPLERRKKSKLINGIQFGFLGFFLSIFWFVLRRLYLQNKPVRITESRTKTILKS